jgi:hypothetical protein
MNSSFKKNWNNEVIV